MKIAVIEDTPSALRFCEASLLRAGHQVITAETAKAAEVLLVEQRPDLALLDLTLPDASGLDLIPKMMGKSQNCPLIVVTGDASVNTAVKAMRLGARDFIVKPYPSSRLLESVSSVMGDKRCADTVGHPTSRFDHIPSPGFQEFIGDSECMQVVYKMLRAAGPSSAPIFITGESGTGKELAAEAAHKMSRRRDGPFVAINCSAIPRDLVESELFGHLKGSFTGAGADRLGACRQAHGGTLFLDEICEMQVDLQAKLLRFLQSGSIRPVGSMRTEDVDVRVICATNKDPVEEVRAGRFREDLFYRLHVVRICLPPLRERGEDALHLAVDFANKYAAEEGKSFFGFAKSAEHFIASAPWRGNVRELQNTIRRAIVMNSEATLTSAMLAHSCWGDSRFEALPQVAAEDQDTGGLLDRWVEPSHIMELPQLERLAIERSIDLCFGNIPKAAGYLGVSPSTIYRKKAEWGSRQAKLTHRERKEIF